MILCCNPLAQYKTCKKEIDKAVLRVLKKGRYILGDEVRYFEKEFARFIGVSHAVGVGSGTEALRIAILACGIGKGDEVITVSHTAVATVAAIEATGARPVFVDIDRASYTIDVKKIKKSITARTRAIIPVHIYGQPADLSAILKIASRYGLKVIEDCAQAHGAKYKGRRVGSWGDIGCFSFYPTKNLGGAGDGGMLVTGDPRLAEKARLLREYGWAERYISSIPGWNTRLDELQAAILRIKLKRLDADNRKRRNIAAFYDRQLADTGLVLPSVENDCQHAYHLYVARTVKRDVLHNALKRRGINTLIHYPLPVHLQPAYKGKFLVKTDLRETERAANEVISLPIYPELRKQEIRKVCSEIKQFFKGA